MLQLYTQCCAQQSCGQYAAVQSCSAAGAAAPHSKSGVTVNPKLADRNQQGTLPHLRLMEWVWSYFVDSSADSDTRHDAGHTSSTQAGAVHAQPSKQASGSSHWEGQEDDKSRKQQRTDGQQTAPSSSREVISKTGRSILLLAEAAQKKDSERGLALSVATVIDCTLQQQESWSGVQNVVGFCQRELACATMSAILCSSVSCMHILAHHFAC